MKPISTSVLRTVSSSSSQDGGIGRNPSLPHTTKRRITTNLKSINNHKCQKIKLHGTLTTKELKKQSSRPTRPVRQVEGENPLQGSRLCRWAWLNRKLRLRDDCGLWRGLPQWENSQSHISVRWKAG